MKRIYEDSKGNIFIFFFFELIWVGKKKLEWENYTLEERDFNINKVKIRTIVKTKACLGVLSHRKCSIICDEIFPVGKKYEE